MFAQARKLKPDIIYVGGDIVHSKTQGISPELIDCLCWWFTELSKIAPTHVILGNHDGLILNKDRQDAITPIIDALNNDDIYLYKDSGTYSLNSNFELCVFSCFDEENWERVKPNSDKISLALYHGAVRGSLTDTDWQIEGEISISAFDDYDFALLGDIHKRQFLNESNTVAYCGSTIQQNYGEDSEKGFLFWDIRSSDDFDVSFHQVENDYSFATIDWRGDVETTVSVCDQYPNLTRFRIRSDNYISQSDSRRLQKILAKKKNASEVVFKIDTKTESDYIKNTNNDILDLRDVSVHKNLIRDYYASHNLNDNDLASIDSMTEKYLSEVLMGERDLRNIKWSISSIKFDNIFSYGPKNYINFESLPGITGIFGKNAKGKSSIIGTIAYSLFNTTDRGSIKNLHIINTRHNSCSAEIDLRINNVPYRIVRSTVKKQNKAGFWAPTTLKFFKLDRSGDIIEDLTEEQRRETEKIVRAMIGTPEEFLMTSLASQGEMNTFIREKASQRKTILTNFLDLSVFDKMNDLAKKKSNDLRAEARHLSDNNWKKKIDALLLDIDNHQGKLTICRDDIKRSKTSIENLTRELHESSDTVYVDIQEVKNAEKAHRSSITRKENLQIELDSISDEIFDTEEKIRKIKLFLETFDIDDVKEKRAAQLQIEKTLFEIKNSYNLEKKELTILSLSVARLKEVPCGDKFPTCKFIKESHKNKKKIEVQEEKVAALKTHLSDISSAFKKLSKEDYESKIEKYNSIIQKKAGLIASISEKRVKINSLENDIRNSTRVIKEKKEKLQDLKSRHEKQDDNDSRTILSNRIQDKKKNLNKLDNDRIKIINKVAKLSAELSVVEKQKDDYERINKDIRIFDLFIQATSKRGIPVQIINALLPKINIEISKILKGVVDFTVILEADLDSNAMDIYIDYGDSRRIVELGSGMEKMLASLAIRVALINISSLPKTNMLMIDEGFGALDETNLEACGKLLHSLKKWFKNIIVISHIDTVKDIVDNTIDITKKGKDSHVRCL
jgi:DNA repair exonuclease SbcCD ATPase subunit